MKKILTTLVLSLVLIFTQTTTVSSAKATRDSEELRLQDMLMNMLTPYIQKDLTSYYHPKILKDFSPQVTPWMIEVIETKRVNGFRGFILEITFEIEPTDGGHHIPVGKDRMTYQISTGPEVKLINHTHLKTYEAFIKVMKAQKCCFYHKTGFHLGYESPKLLPFPQYGLSSWL